MWSHEDLRMSAYLEVNIDAQVEPSEGKCGMKRDGTPRCLGRGDGLTEGEKHAAHEGWNPTFGRRDRESNRRACTVDEGRVTGSATLLGRATTSNRGRRNVQRMWSIVRLRRFMWKGRACSKWKTKLS